MSWSPLKNCSFANFGHPVSKSWLRPCSELCYFFPVLGGVNGEDDDAHIVVEEYLSEDESNKEKDDSEDEETEEHVTKVTSSKSVEINGG